MKAKLTLLVYLLLIPAAAVGTAKAIKGELDSQWQSVLEKEYPHAGAKLAQVGLIALAGRLARRRRRLLLALFRPGLHLTMLTLSVLTCLHAGLGIAAIYYGESVFWNQLHVRLMGALAIGAVVGIVSMLRAQWSAVQKATTTALGKSLTPADQPKLWQFVKSLAKEIGTVAPDSIVVGLDPNFYVTEADVICLDGKLRGRTMYVSLPLCRILSLDEFKAVLGHELAHYRGLDTQFSQGFYPIYRGTGQALAHLSSAPKGAASLAVLPAIHTLSYFLDAF